MLSQAFRPKREGELAKGTLLVGAGWRVPEAPSKDTFQRAGRALQDGLTLQMGKLRLGAASPLLSVWPFNSPVLISPIFKMRQLRLRERKRIGL